MNKKNKIEHRFYYLRLNQAIALILFIFIIFFHIMPKKFKHVPRKPQVIKFDFVFADIPVTTQHVRRGKPRPERPVIPVPSEDPQFPDDETIDETNVIWDLGDSPDGNAGLTIGAPDTIPPRPLVQVLPEYPKNLQKQKVGGNVKLLIKIDHTGKVIDVVVSKNTTGNQDCQLAAVSAAYKSKYLPAKANAKSIEMWTTCEYSFENR